MVGLMSIIDGKGVKKPSLLLLGQLDLSYEAPARRQYLLPRPLAHDDARQHNRTDALGKERPARIVVVEAGGTAALQALQHRLDMRLRLWRSARDSRPQCRQHAGFFRMLGVIGAQIIPDPLGHMVGRGIVIACEHVSSVRSPAGSALKQIRL